jgi:hypothetical protein
MARKRNRKSTIGKIRWYKARVYPLALQRATGNG